MRQIAQMKNMLLNEYGLYQIVQGKRIPLQINSEEDVFRYLGLEYIPPEQRDNFTYRRIKKGIL
jgi:DNA polymerase/3'-5' exonuclease PolX